MNLNQIISNQNNVGRNAIPKPIVKARVDPKTPLPSFPGKGVAAPGD